jgi:ABC-type sugar transport system substrate-binding protein
MADRKSRVLGLFLRALDTPYQELLRADCHEMARVHGFALREVNASNDVDTQRRQIEECLRDSPGSRPNVLLVNPVREAALQMLAWDAARLGVGWVSLNRTCDYVGDLRREHPSVPFFCVDVDQQQIGRIQGRQFRALLPQGGRVVYLHGPLSTSSARLRLAGVQAELSRTAIDLATARADWSVDGGARATRAWLARAGDRTHRPRVIGAQNDSMAVGARIALSEADVSVGVLDLANVYITGCDGLPAYGRRLVTSRRLAATIVVPPTGRVALEMVARAIDDPHAAPTVDTLLDVRSFPDVDTLAMLAAREASGPPA